ncbi:serine protease [Mesorhizobium sp.]|uniref:S1C family serine protease n=1 Tax=Mesorhizobium sp. TaxID=1871066 RepID=UPI0025EA276B|nr:serine protease [Mesorhizobium sp.]
MLIAPAAAEEPIGTGTAFLINSEGWAVTNAHVVQDCTRVTATGGSTTSDVKMDVRNDLAVLRISAVPAGVVRLRHAGARLGEDIAAFGYPLGSVLSSSVKVRTGNVNSLIGLGDDTRYLQISTPIQPGNSGGPVVDRRGALVGITTATLKPEAGGGALPQNVNFALRATLLQTFLESRGIKFEYAPEDAAELHTADLADKVQPAVVQLFCYGTNPEPAQTEVAAATRVPAPDPYRPMRPFSILDNHDVVGFDYATLRNVSQQQCQQACNEDGHATP